MAEKNIGRFVWYELMTSDVQGAIAFYTEVIGWKTAPWETGDYTMWVSGLGPIGGVMKLTEDARKMGTPPNWTASVQVANVDATVAQAQSLGGKVYVPPMDIPKVGRYAVLADPQGAAIGIFAPASAMEQHDNTKSGEFCWNELLTSDHRAAFAFYSKLFGWEKLEAHDMGPMGEYLIYGFGSTRLGGMFTKGKDIPTPPCFMYYVQTLELDAALARARAKGAKVLNGPMDVPGGARIVQLLDPQGAAISMHEQAKGNHSH